MLTHGHLPENNIHGGALTSMVDVRKLPNGPLTTEVRIKGYTYLPGDLSLLGQPGARIPTSDELDRLYSRIRPRSMT